jgi:membrane-bound ClpP family serine protease
MGLILIVVGLLLWLLGGWTIIGLILIVVGLILLFAPGPWYGYGWYRGRSRAKPP